MRLGLVGLPLAGKTTVFNALTGADAATGGFTQKGKTNIRVVQVPDARLAHLRDVFKPRKYTPATVEYVDFAGIQRGEEDEAFRAAARDVDAVVHVVRAFEDPGVPHVREVVDPARDLEEVLVEFALADLDVVEKRLKRLRVDVTRPSKFQDQNRRELAALERVHGALAAGLPASSVALTADEEKTLRSYAFLTRKPAIVVVNAKEGATDADDAVTRAAGPHPVVVLSARIEAEVAQLEPGEREAFAAEMGIVEPAMVRLVKVSYAHLALRSFFTVGEDEVRAWTIGAGASAVEAAGRIHTDLARGFIRAEVISYEEFVACGASMAGAKAQGRLRLEGKEYVVEDGDIINVRFSV